MERTITQAALKANLHSAAALCSLLLCVAGPVAAQTTIANSFGAFESFVLPNGMRLWYGHVPGLVNTSAAVIVPAGRDQDPQGREQTAHLLEHVLLSDRHGRTEAELARELANRGGTHNGITATDYSYYPVHVPGNEAVFGLEWLYGVVAPRVFSASLVERNRDPVALEIGARRHGPLERVAALYLHAPPLRPAGFWKREFGLDIAADRQIDRYAALQRISASELQSFYDTHYVSAGMALIIVSGQPRSALQPTINATFATLPWRPAPEPRRADTHHGESRRFSWHLARITNVTLFFRLPQPSALDQLRMIFIEDLLRLRLMERLRRGTDKSVYGVEVAARTRSGAAFVHISLDVDPSQEELARRVVEEELQRIRTAQVDTTAFYADRTTLQHKLRASATAPALVSLAAERFHDPRHQALPDLGEYYATVGADSIAAMALRTFQAENRVLRVLRPPPAPLALLVLGALAVAAAAAAGYRRIVFRAADMHRIRYVAHVRQAFPTRAVVATATLLGVLVALRLGAAAAQFAAENAVLRMDSPALHALAAALLIAALTLIALTLTGLTVHKILVFEHELRLKSPTWRSLVIPAREIIGARVVSSRAGLRLRRPVLGAGRGVYVELASRDGYLLSVRQPEQACAAIQALASSARSEELQR